MGPCVFVRALLLIDIALSYSQILKYILPRIICVFYFLHDLVRETLSDLPSDLRKSDIGPIKNVRTRYLHQYPEDGDLSRWPLRVISSYIL